LNIHYTEFVKEKRQKKGRITEFVQRKTSEKFQGNSKKKKTSENNKENIPRKSKNKITKQHNKHSTTLNSTVKKL
jgi:hypothetical protein